MTCIPVRGHSLTGHAHPIRVGDMDRRQWQVAAGGGRWWQVVAAEGGRGRKRREDSREWQGGGKQGGKGWLEAVWWGCMGQQAAAGRGRGGQREAAASW